MILLNDYFHIGRQSEWIKNNQERINLLFEKDTKARLEEGCKGLGVSKSESARQAIEEKLKSIGI